MRDPYVTFFFEKEAKKLFSMKTEHQLATVVQMELVNDTYFETKIVFYEKERKTGEEVLKVYGKKITTIRDKELLISENVTNGFLGKIKSYLTHLQHDFMKEAQNHGRVLDERTLLRGIYAVEAEKVLFTLKKIEEIRDVFEKRIKQNENYLNKNTDELFYLKSALHFEEDFFYGKDVKRKNIYVNTAECPLYRGLPFIQKENITHHFYFKEIEKGIEYGIRKIENQQIYSVQERFAFLLDLLICIIEFKFSLSIMEINTANKTKAIIKSFSNYPTYWGVVAAILDKGMDQGVYSRLKKIHFKIEKTLFFKTAELIEEEYENKRFLEREERFHTKKNGEAVKKSKRKRKI